MLKNNDICSRNAAEYLVPSTLIDHRIIDILQKNLPHKHGNIKRYTVHIMMRFFAYRDSFDLRISYRQFLWDLSGKSCDLRKEMIVPKVPGAVNDSVAIPRSLFGWQPQSVSVPPVDWRFVGGLSGVQRGDAAFVYGS